jgi:hypothetical protein
LSVPLLYPLYCLYLFITHCIVCTSSLPIVLYVPLLYPLHCLYLFVTHCIVCTSSMYCFWLPLWLLPTFLKEDVTAYYHQQSHPNNYIVLHILQFTNHWQLHSHNQPNTGLRCPHKMMFRSSLPPVVCRRARVLFMLLVFVCA